MLWIFDLPEMTTVLIRVYSLACDLQVVHFFFHGAHFVVGELFRL